MKAEHLELPETADAAHSAPFENEPRPAWDDFDLDESPGFFERHRVVVSIVIAAAIGALAWFWNDLFPKTKAGPQLRENIVTINVPPPPPPPPILQPPPPPPPQVEQKMIEQTPVENEPKPDEAPDEPPAPDLGTGIAGNGPPDGFGLTTGRGNRAGGAGGAGNQQRSRWGWYAGQVQSRIQQAVQTNHRTRTAAIRVEVKVWADATGRITRANLVNSTGDRALDAALRDEVFTGLQLSEAPPQGMPMPITMRVTARRP